jgi:hypothetical protein
VGSGVMFATMSGEAAGLASSKAAFIPYDRSIKARRRAGCCPLGHVCWRRRYCSKDTGNCKLLCDVGCVLKVRGVGSEGRRRGMVFPEQT